MIRSIAEQKVKERYEKLGYTVVSEPSKSMLPFDLGNYTPDLLCTRGEEKLLIEVKGAVWRDSLERYRDIAETVASTAGWRFLIIQLKELDNDIVSESISEVNTQPILDKLKIARDAGLVDAALVYAWNILMILLRRKAEKENSVKIETIDRNIINALYSSGAISISDYDRINEFMRLRNQAVHGIQSEIEKTRIDELLALVIKYNSEWDDLIHIGKSPSI